MNKLRLICLLIILWVVSWSGCTTTEKTPVMPPNPPEFTKVPFPEGADLADMSAIFTDPNAPKLPEFALKCDHDFRKLTGMTRSIPEIEQGIRELVKNDPVHYHWCFYGKLLQLENDLIKDSYIEERQKNVLNTFQFLTPIAKAFILEFHDSRYLRAAVFRYQSISEWVFYRKLELTPQGTVEMVQPKNPFGLWRKGADGFAVLEKYNILHPSGTPSGTPSSSPSSLPADKPLAPTAGFPGEPVAPLVAPSAKPAPKPTASSIPKTSPSLSPVGQ